MQRIPLDFLEEDAFKAAFEQYVRPVLKKVLFLLLPHIVLESPVYWGMHEYTNLLDFWCHVCIVFCIPFMWMLVVINYLVLLQLQFSKFIIFALICSKFN